MVGRASEAMWIFSTVLCVVVGIMVMAGVAYQIHLDRLTKRRKKENREEQRGEQMIKTFTSILTEAEFLLLVCEHNREIGLFLLPFTLRKSLRVSKIINKKSYILSGLYIYYSFLSVGFEWL